MGGGPGLSKAPAGKLQDLGFSACWAAFRLEMLRFSAAASRAWRGSGRFGGFDVSFTLRIDLQARLRLSSARGTA